MTLTRQPGALVIDRNLRHRCVGEGHDVARIEAQRRDDTLEDFVSLDVHKAFTGTEAELDFRKRIAAGLVKTLGGAILEHCHQGRSPLIVEGEAGEPGRAIAKGAAAGVGKVTSRVEGVP